ncbi:MAG: hypothetical protein ACE5I7_17540, partial [Candidatus Binatia bacterium]
LAFHNQAVGGTTTAVLPQQIASLPTQLPGPVAVVVSANGDFRAAHVECCGRFPQDAARTLARNIGAVLSDLLRPGRFGPGVDVRVFWTNVVPPTEIVACPNLALWNAVIEETVAAFDQTVVDAFQHFRGHGCNTDGSWLEGLIDCVHYNPTGHDQMARLLYLAIVGAPRPGPTN